MTDASAVSDVGSDESSSEEQELLNIGREEARQTLDHQIRTLDDIDTKASKILRLNVALLSILLTSVSIASRSTAFETAAFLNTLSLVGISALLASTAFAALTYTSSDVKIGLTSNDVSTIVDDGYGSNYVQEGLVESYANWIEFNAGTNARTTPLVTLTIVLAVHAITFMTLGILVAVLDSIPSFVVPITILGLLGFTIATELPAQVGRWYAEVEPRRSLRPLVKGFTKRLSPKRDNE